MLMMLRYVTINGFKFMVKCLGLFGWDLYSGKSRLEIKLGIENVH